MVCTLAAARPLQAQAAGDTTLAGAVATVLADSLLDRLTRGPIVWRESSGPIDPEVFEALRTHPKLRGPVRDPRHALWIGVRQVGEQGDTTWVVVEFDRHYRDIGFLTFFIEDGPTSSCARKGLAVRAEPVPSPCRRRAGTRMTTIAGVPRSLVRRGRL